MKVQYDLVVGENKFTLIEDVEADTDLFKKFSFYSNLPKTGPNGETDLVLRHRVAKSSKGPVDYYSIVSEKAGMEFKLGQLLNPKGGLFPKGWEPLFRKENAEAEGEEVSAEGGLGTSVTAGASVGLGATPTPAPAPAATAAPRAAAPATAAVAKPATAPTTTKPAVNPAVASQATNILAKFGI